MENALGLLTVADVCKISFLTRVSRVGAAVALTGALVIPVVAQAPEGRQRDTGDAAKKEEAGVPIPPETNSVTKHDWTAGGQTIHYTATAGNLLIRDDQDKASGSIFYVAYTQDGVEAKTRPV